MTDEIKADKPEDDIVKGDTLSTQQPTDEEKKQIATIANYLMTEFFRNIHKTDAAKKTNPIEVVMRSAIKSVIITLGPTAVPQQIANGLYELLHIGENITYLSTEYKAQVILDKKRKRHDPNKDVI